MPEELPTLPELFRARGYRTFGFAANPNVDAPMGFARGFDHFECLPDADADELCAAVLARESELAAGRPSLLYLHYMDPHVPLEGRPPWYEPGEDPLADRIARYDSEVRFLDGLLERHHRRLGWDRSTAVLFVTDHGEGCDVPGRRS